MKAFVIVCLVTVLSAAVSAQQKPWKTDPSQTQHQTQQQNVGNTTTNSHNVTDEATGGQSSSTSGAVSAAGATASGGTGGNGGGGGNVTDNTSIPRQTATAYAPPAFHTAPCVKAWGAGAQAPVAGISLGGGKVDKGCDIRETAEEFRNAGSLTAFCKLMITEPSAIKAEVTFADCIMEVGAVQEPTPAVAPAPAAPVLPQVIVPAPQVTINLPPQPIPASPLPFVAEPLVKKHVHKKQQDCPTVEK